MRMTDVQSDGETVWLTQAQLAELFDTSKQNIFQEGKLSRETTVKEYLIVRTKRNRKISKDAETEYEKYQAATLLPVESAYLESMKALEKKVKSDKKEAK